MSGRQQTKGAYRFCGREMVRSSLTRHLPVCPHRRETINEAGKSGFGASSCSITWRLQMHMGKVSGSIWK